MTAPRNLIGRGSAWVLRWFAKPVVTGSIPATASTPDDLASTPDDLAILFDAVDGPEAARAMLKSSAFNKRYEPPQSLVHLGREVVWHLRKDRDEWRAKCIEARRELSAAKRGAA